MLIVFMCCPLQNFGGKKFGKFGKSALVRQNILV